MKKLLLLLCLCLLIISGVKAQTKLGSFFYKVPTPAPVPAYSSNNNNINNANNTNNTKPTYQFINGYPKITGI